MAFLQESFAVNDHNKGGEKTKVRGGAKGCLGIRELEASRVYLRVK